jgi:uncharacterized protein (DUF433 family)
MRFVQFYFGMPLAMVVLSATAVPIFHRAKVYTADHSLENRFDSETRAGRPHFSDGRFRRKSPPSKPVSSPLFTILKRGDAMIDEYAEQRNGGYYVSGTRVSLDSIVYAYRLGESAESIRQNFPSLSLVQVYGPLHSTC